MHILAEETDAQILSWTAHYMHTTVILSSSIYRDCFVHTGYIILSGALTLCWHDSGSGSITHEELMDKATAFAVHFLETLKLQGLVIATDRLSFVNMVSVDYANHLVLYYAKCQNFIVSFRDVPKSCNILGQELLSLDRSNRFRQIWFSFPFHKLCNINTPLYYFE